LLIESACELRDIRRAQGRRGLICHLRIVCCIGYAGCLEVRIVRRAAFRNGAERVGRRTDSVVALQIRDVAAAEAVVEQTEAAAQHSLRRSLSTAESVGE